MNRRGWTFLALALSLGSALAAGGAMKQLKVEAQLGIRFLSAVPATLREQSPVEAAVVSPEKLAAHGFKGLKTGDKLSLVLLEQGRRFSVASAAEKGIFRVDDMGGLKLEPQSLKRLNMTPMTPVTPVAPQRPGAAKPAIK